MESQNRCLFSISLLLLSIHSAAAAAAAGPTPSNGDSDFIRSSCNVTSYPDVCYATLSPHKNSINTSMALLAETAISVSLKKSKRSAALFALQKPVAGSRAAAAINVCVETLTLATDNARDSLKQLKDIAGKPVESVRLEVGNIQSWMSAAMTDQETCTDGFEEEPAKAEVVQRVQVAKLIQRVEQVKKVTTNALGLFCKHANC